MNVTTRCREKSFKYPIYKYAYEEQCLQDLILYADNDKEGVCGVKVANDVLGHLLGELRIEAQFANWLGVLALLMALQIGGISAPKQGHNVEIAAWSIWMLVVLLQMLTGPLAMGLVGAAYGEMQGSLGPCAVKWKGDYDMIDVVALPTFIFQPAVMFPFVLMVIYFFALLEGVKVWCGAREVEVKAWSWKWFMCCGKDEGDDYLPVSMFWWFSFRIIVPVCLFCVLLWFFSLSWIFGLVFFPVHLIFILILDMLAVFALGFIYHHLKEKKFENEKLEQLKELVLSTIWWAEAFTKAWLGEVFGVKAVQDWDDPIACQFTGFIFFAIIPIALSPLVVNGTWLAAHVYAGHSPEENMALVRDMYEFTFGCFADAQFQVPSLDFNLAHVGTAFEALLGAIGAGLTNFQAPEYLLLTKACSLINFSFSLIKTFVSSTVSGLALFDYVTPPVPFFRIAICADYGDAKNAVAVTCEKEKERRKSSAAKPPQEQSSCFDCIWSCISAILGCFWACLRGIQGRATSWLCSPCDAKLVKPSAEWVKWSANSSSFDYDSLPFGPDLIETLSRARLSKKSWEYMEKNLRQSFNDMPQVLSTYGESRV